MFVIRKRGSESAEVEGDTRGTRRIRVAAAAWRSSSGSGHDATAAAFKLARRRRPRHPPSHARRSPHSTANTGRTCTRATRPVRRTAQAYRLDRGHVHRSTARGLLLVARGHRGGHRQPAVAELPAGHLRRGRPRHQRSAVPHGHRGLPHRNGQTLLRRWIPVVRSHRRCHDRLDR